MGQKNKSIIRSFATISIGTVINVIVGLLTVPIITRLVDPFDYGKLSIFTLYAEIAIMVLCLGLDQALVRFYYREDDINYKRQLLKECWRIPFILALAISIIFLVLVYFGIVKYDFSFVISVILVGYVLFQLFNRFSFLLLRLQYDSKSYALLNVIHKALYAALVVFFLYIIDGQDLLILTSCTMVSVAIVTVAGMIKEKNIWFGTYSNEYKINTRELIKYGAPFILSMGVVTLFHGIDKMALNYYCGSEEVGIYSGAQNLIKIFTIVQTSFNSLWAPMAMENYQKNKNDRTLYQKACSYVTIVMFLIGLTLIVGKDIFALFLGNKYRQAAYVLPCLIFYPIMYTISETTCVGIDFAKKSQMHIWVAVGSCIANIVGNSILVPIYGGKGAAISTGFSYIVFFTLRTIFANRCFPTNYRLKRLYLLVAVVFAYAILNTFVSFGYFSIVGYLACLILLLLLYRNDVIEILHILRKVLHKEKN